MTQIDDLLAGRILLLSSNSQNVLKSYAAGIWNDLSLVNARGLAVKKSAIAAAGSNEITYFDGDTGVTVSKIIPADASTHELAFLDDGTLLACSPTRSSLTAYTLEGSTDIWTVPGVDLGTTDSRSWVNGISTEAGLLAYVTVLGVANTPGGWRAEAAAERSVLIDTRTNKTVLSGLFFPHSPTVLPDGTVLFLNSGHGQVCSWKPGEVSYTVIANLGAWTRGIVMLDQTHALVGVSQGRMSAIPALTTNALAQPGVALIDITTGVTLQFMALDLQEIFDLALSTVRPS